MPRDFTFVLPDDWARIRLQPPSARKRDVEAITASLTRTRSDRDSLAPQLRQMIDQACDRTVPGSVEFYLSLSRAAHVPIPCSMTVTLGDPADPPATPHSVIRGFLSLGGPDQGELSVHLGEVKGRLERRLPASVESQTFDSVVVQHAFVIPGTTGFVLLDFSTPLVNVAEAMTALFDAIASSFTWVW